jgi:hypothetical protein
MIRLRIEIATTDDDDRLDAQAGTRRDRVPDIGRIRPGYRPAPQLEEVWRGPVLDLVALPAPARKRWWQR